MSQFPPPEMNLSIFNPYFFDESNQYLLSTGNEAISYAGTTDFNGSIITGQQLTFNDNTISNRFISGLYELQMCNNTGTNNVFNILTNSTNTILNSLQYNSSMSFYTTDGSGNNELILNLTNSNIQLGYASSSISFLGNNFDSSSSSFSLLSTPTTLTIGSNCTSNLYLGNSSGNVVINGTIKLNNIDTTNTTVTLFSTPTNVTLFNSLVSMSLGKTSSSISFLGNVFNSPSSSFTLLSSPTSVTAFSGCSSNLILGNASGNTQINGSVSITSMDTGNSSITLFSTPTSVTMYSNLTSMSLGKTSSSISFLGNVFNSQSTSFTLLSSPTSVSAFGNCTGNLIIGNSSGNTTINGTLTIASSGTFSLNCNTLSLPNLTSITCSTSLANIFINNTGNCNLLTGTTGTLNFLGNTSTINLNSSTINFPNTTVISINSSLTNFLDTQATLTIAKISTTLNIATNSTSTSTITISNPTYASSNILVLNCAYINSSYSTINLFTSTVSTLYFASICGNIYIGNNNTSASNVTIGNPLYQNTFYFNCSSIQVQNSVLSNVALYTNAYVTTGYLFSRCTNLYLSESSSSSSIIKIGTDTFNNTIYLNGSIIGISGVTITSINLFCQSIISSCNLLTNVTTLNIATSSTSISTITIGNNTYNNNIYLNGSLLGITAIDSSNSSITIFSTPTTVSIGKVSSTLSLIGNILNSTSSSFTLLGNPTSITAFGNCSTLTLGNASGTTTINGNLSLSSSSFDLANSSVTLFSTPTTISCFPNVITLNIATTSPSSSTIIIGNNTYSNSITLYGSSLNCSTSLASIFTQTTSSINLLGGVTSTNTITIGGGCWIVLNANYIYSNQASIVLFSSSTSVNFASIATTISIGTSASSSQSISILNSAQSGNGIYLNAGIIGIAGSTISTLNLFTQSVITTCNFLTNCPLISIGSTSSTFNIASSTINIAHCTSINNGTTGNMAFCNSTTGYVSIGGASLGLTLGCTTSANVIQGSSISFSNATSLICSSSLANVFNQTTVGNVNLFSGITGTSTVTIGGGCWIVLNANYIYSNQSSVVLFSNSINSNYSAGSQYVSIATGYSGSQYITLGTSTNTGGLMYLNSGSIGIGGSTISSINLFTESVITSANLLTGSSLSTLNFGSYSSTLNICTSVASGAIINFGNSSFPSYSTVNINANTISTTATSLTLFNTNSTTIHAFGASSTIVIGSSGGSFTINNSTTYVGTTLNTTSTGSAYLFNTTCTMGYLFGNCSNITIGANSSTLTLNSSTIVSNSTSLTLFNSTSTSVTCFNGATLGVNLGNTGYANSNSQSNTSKPNSCIQFNAPISLPPAYNSLSGGGAVNHWTNIPLCMYGYQTIAMTSSGTYSPAPSVTFYIYKLGHIVQISWNSFTLGTQTSSGSIYFNLYSSIPEINSNTTVQCPIYNGSTVGFAQLTSGNSPLQFFTGIGFSSTYTQETIGGGTLTYICALTSNGY